MTPHPLMELQTQTGLRAGSEPCRCNMEARVWCNQGRGHKCALVVTSLLFAVLFALAKRHASCQHGACVPHGLFWVGTCAHA